MASTFQADCEKYFGTSCLYTILGLKKHDDWSKEQLKAAYYKAARKHHPDRCGSEDKKEATAKFQLISKAFSLLSDDGKRKLYNRTGTMDDDDLMESEWTTWFHVVTSDEIEAFKGRYQGSAEEVADVKDAYVKYEGDMDRIMDSVLFAECDEEQRIRKIIESLIKDGEVESYERFVNEPARKAKNRLARWKRERRLFERSAKAGGEGSFKSLVETVRARQQSRANFLEDLEQRYAKAGQTEHDRTAKRQKGEKGPQQDVDGGEVQKEVKRKRGRAAASVQEASADEQAEMVSKGDQDKKRKASGKQTAKRNDGRNETPEYGDGPQRSVPAKRTKKQEADTKGKEEARTGDEEVAPIAARGSKRAVQRKKEKEVGAEVKMKKSSDKNAEPPRSPGAEEGDVRPNARRARKKAVKTDEQNSGQHAAPKTASVATAKVGGAKARTKKSGKGSKRDGGPDNGASEDTDEPPQSSNSAPPARTQAAPGGTKKKGRKAVVR